MLVYTDVLFRVIHAQNDLLTPFELMAHNIWVYGGRSTHQNGNLEKKFLARKNFSKKIFFFDFYDHDRYQNTPLGLLILIKYPKKFRAVFGYILAYKAMTRNSSAKALAG